MLKPLFFFLVIFLLSGYRGNVQPVKKTGLVAENILASLIANQPGSATQKKEMADFYRNRNYQFVWFTASGLAPYTMVFWHLYFSNINLLRLNIRTDKSFAEQLAMFQAKPAPIDLNSAAIAQMEMKLTECFYRYVRFAYEGTVDPERLGWHIEQKRLQTAALLDSFIVRSESNIEQWEPVNGSYRRLNKELAHYSLIDRAGGWNRINTPALKQYQPGDSALVIKDIKRRLAISGEYSMNDTSQLFTISFVPVVQTAQKQFGLEQTGIIDASFIKQLNISVGTRIRQILINLERMRWMPEQHEGSRILVNIPDFKLLVFDSSKKILEIDVVVGKAAHNTVIFNSTLQFVVFSPYWNIPATIVRKEILPALHRNPGYLVKMNIERIDSNGVDAGYRQKPGGNNALGGVKFIFPNRYNIYFHDTPAKSLFSENKRAFSHGCIRLKEPAKLAAYLLRNEGDWNADRIISSMSSGTERWITLKQLVPVFISYFTCWVDSDGMINFRNDIYGQDKKMYREMFNE